MPCGPRDLLVLVQTVSNVLNNRMGRPHRPHLKDMLKYTVSRSHSNMGRFPGVASKVNIGEFTNVTFRDTPRDFRMS